MASLETDFQEIRDNQRQNDVDFAAYKLPQLPDNRDEVYDRLVLSERLFSPNRTLTGYDNGTAKIEDELYVRDGRGALLTAEHATARMRLKQGADKRVHQGGDMGTGALGLVFSEDVGSAFIAPLGRQTMDANHDIEHPLNRRAHDFIIRPDIGSAVSLHRLFLGRVASLADVRGYNLIFGIGDEASDETVDAVDKLLEIAKVYDLRAGVNQAVLAYEDDGVTPARKESGEPKTLTYAAAGEDTTRTFAQRVTREIGKPPVALQIEISQANLVIPEDYRYKDLYRPAIEGEKIGPFLAYQFLKDAAPVLMGDSK
jgi:hypothetical protein